MKAYDFSFLLLPIVGAIQVLHNAANGDFENAGILRKNFTEDVQIYNYSVCSWFKLDFGAKRFPSLWVHATKYRLFWKGVCKF